MSDIPKTCWLLQIHNYNIDNNYIIIIPIIIIIDNIILGSLLREYRNKASTDLILFRNKSKTGHVIYVIID